MSETFNILVLCTGNSARSILSEAILNSLGEGRIKAYSAGSFPTGRVNPFAKKLLDQKGYDTSDLRSKSWDEFSADDAPNLDLVITVCDNAAGETCPVWIGGPLKMHWGFPDPAAAVGSDDDKMASFEEVYASIYKAMEYLVSMQPEQISTDELKSRMSEFEPE